MFCPKCGATNDDTSKFCLGCGWPLSQPATPAAPPAPPAAPVYSAPPQYQAPQSPPPKKGHAGIIIVVLLLVLAIAAAGVWFFFIRDDDKDGKETTKQNTTVSATTKPSTTPEQGDEEDNTTSSDIYSFLSGTWPDSPLLADVPKPDFGSIATTSSDNDTVTVSIGNVTADNYNAYIEKIKNAGFDKDVSTANILGSQTYSANNGNGLEITVVNSIVLTGWIVITVDRV